MELLVPGIRRTAINGQRSGHAFCSSFSFLQAELGGEAQVKVVVRVRRRVVVAIGATAIGRIVVVPAAAPIHAIGARTL